MATSTGPTTTHPSVPEPKTSRSPAVPEPTPGDVTADVLIIGGGVIGLAIAWRAAQRGMRVVLADPEPGRGASYAAAGMLTPVAEAAYAERELFQLGDSSLRRYPAFVAELADQSGLPTGFRQTGTLQVAYDADDLAVLNELAILRESFGVPTQRLTSRECRAAEPMLGPVTGGLLVTDDASIDPRLLTTALLAAATRAGVTHLPLRALRLLAGQAARGAELDDGSTVSAGQVVLSAGWASAAIAGLPPDAAPPVRPVKGQILRLRPTPATLATGLPPVMLNRTVRGVVRGSSVYLVPRDNGELVVGATQEEMGADTTVTAGGVWQLLRDARVILPGVAELEMAEAVAGLRPGTPDNAPVLGPSSLPGLVLATGHFRGGVLLAPITADLITDLLTTGTLAASAARFSAGRFPGRDSAAREAADTEQARSWR
jgi:glycine oxidase